MPRLRFESTIPVFEWMKKFRALDDAVIVIGFEISLNHKLIFR
jgi:hypothetical protein